MGEGKGRSTGPPTTWEVSVGRPSEHGVIQQRAHTLIPPSAPYQHCICNQLRFAKLYTRPNLSVRLGLFIAGQLQPQGVMSFGWQQSVGLTPPLLPVRRSTSQGPPPNHRCVAWYLLCCSIHALSASSTPSAALVSSTRRVSSFEILISRNKILEN